MLFDLEVWVVGLIAALPVITAIAAWLSAPGYYEEKAVAAKDRNLYLCALLGASTIAVTYASYFLLFFLPLYQVHLLRAAWFLDRMKMVAPLPAIAVLICLKYGRGPIRAPLSIAVIWMALYLFLRLPLLHYA